MLKTPRQRHRLHDGGILTDWPTFALLAFCYLGWLASVIWLPQVWLPLAIVIAALTITLHSSLSHEVLHGRPFRSRALNAALVFPALNLVVPYIRFRDTHMAHHRDARLTDPYDDPESNFQDPAVWGGWPRWRQRLWQVNNTLLGRIVIGSLLGQALFMLADLQAVRRGDRAVLRAWLWHLPAVAMVLWVLWRWGSMPLSAYALAVWAALGTLKIRTFLEHRADARVNARTAIVEDRGPLALLFLNNNFHAVHHLHPTAPWYRLPALYRAGRAEYLADNGNYRYRSYAEVMARYLWRAKDPVPHPLWSMPED